MRIGSAGQTFSVTGWKVGYNGADPKRLGPIARANQFVAFTTPPALQVTAAFGLRLPDSYFLGLRSAREECRDLLVGSLRGLDFEVAAAPATYFAIATTDGFDEARDDFAFWRRLTHEAGVTAVPISAFFSDGGVRNYISFCFAKTRETLEQALGRLSDWRAKVSATS